MKVNLAVSIFRYLAYEQSSSGGGVVSLAAYRKKYNIPSPTFYRHVKTLKDQFLITQFGRDEYAIDDGLLFMLKSMEAKVPLKDF